MKSNTATNGYLSVVALQDGVGALLNQTSVLGSWYSSLKNTIAAAQLPHPISLWANTEVYYNPNAANPMSLNLVVADMQAVQPDVATYTSFTLGGILQSAICGPRLRCDLFKLSLDWWG